MQLAEKALRGSDWEAAAVGEAGALRLARAALKFNAQAERGFVASPPPAGEPLLLVFGGASVTDMLKNWALHVRELGMGYAVACMDQKLFDTAGAQQIRLSGCTPHHESAADHEARVRAL